MLILKILSANFKRGQVFQSLKFKRKRRPKKRGEREREDEDEDGDERATSEMLIKLYNNSFECR